MLLSEVLARGDVERVRETFERFLKLFPSSVSNERGKGVGLDLRKELDQIFVNGERIYWKKIHGNLIKGLC